jgi:hypothetical protein
MGEEGKRRYYTLNIGDIIALGVHEIEITGETPFTLTDVRKVLEPNIFTIQSVQDNTRSRAGKHWKVEGV